MIFCDILWYKMYGIYFQIRKIRTKKKFKVDDLVPIDNDYLRDLGSRRRKKPEDLKDNDALDVDDLEGNHTIKVLYNFIKITLDRLIPLSILCKL